VPKLLRILLSSSLLAVACSAETIDLFDGFAANWRNSWREQSLFSKPTVYRVTRDKSKPVLHAISQSANSGLLRELKLSPADYPVRLRWQWKIAQTLDAEASEKTRSGDDYVARICLVFETSIIPLRTRSIQYVWSSREPVGASYRSPYSKQVGMIVLQSGDQAAGQWLSEERDIIADYRKYFGRDPKEISAIGIVVDSDNTKTDGEAWFADLQIEAGPQTKVRD